MNMLMLTHCREQLAVRCEYHNDLTSAKNVSCGVWSIKNTFTSASKEFSWVINLCPILHFLHKLNT